MKLNSSALLAALCSSARLGVAANARVYFLDQASSPDRLAHAVDLSPPHARLVLAQRLGVEQYHSADLDQKDVIDAINGFGVSSPLFADVELERSVFVLEEESGIESALSSLNELSHFSISPSPSRDASRALLSDLHQQSLHDLKHGNGVTTSWYNYTSPEHFITKVDALRGQYLAGLFGRNVAYSFTFIILSPDTEDSKEDDIFGSYMMPGMQSQLRKRQFTMSEEPLEDDSLQPVVQSSDRITDFASSNQSEPLPGIFGSCFTSLAACERLTRNCTGHGSCYKKYTNEDAADASPYKNCYTCQCTATSITSENGGKKTTYWGGSACQKRDVSVQFWLIALFTVGLLFVVGFAVGQIWSMGDEQLPSVIGAGVSGPARRS